MWKHALGIRLCQCFPVGVCHLLLCLVQVVGCLPLYLIFLHGIKMKIIFFPVFNIPDKIYQDSFQDPQLLPGLDLESSVQMK